MTVPGPRPRGTGPQRPGTPMTASGSASAPDREVRVRDGQGHR